MPRATKKKATKKKRLPPTSFRFKVVTPSLSINQLRLMVNAELSHDPSNPQYPPSANDAAKKLLLQWTAGGKVPIELNAVHDAFMESCDDLDDDSDPYYW